MKKNLLTVLILALLIVNLVLTSVMMFSVMGTNRKTAELVTDIATVMNLELTRPGEEEAEAVSMEDTAVYAIEGNMTVPLASSDDQDRQRYMVFGIALSMNTKHKDYKKYGETIAEKESLIKDAITTVVSSHTENECRNDLEGLKAEILQALQDLFQSDFIYDIAFSEVNFG